MKDKDTPAQGAGQAPFVHPYAGRKPHIFATTAKLRLIFRAAREGRVHASSVCVLAVILDYMYGRRIESWPGQETLARSAGVSLRTVQYAVKELESEGYLEIIRKLRITNLYAIPQSHLDKVSRDASNRSGMRPSRNPQRPGAANQSRSRPQSFAEESFSPEATSSETDISDAHWQMILEEQRGHM